MKKTKEFLSLSEDCQLNLSDFALFLSVMNVKEASGANRHACFKIGKGNQIPVSAVHGDNLHYTGRYLWKESCNVYLQRAVRGTKRPAFGGRDKKIFLNMASKNGRPELISLLQYMKNTTLDNPDIIVKDERIVDLDRIVGKVKQSEEWEAVKMNILEIGLEAGRKEGLKIGIEEGREKGIKAMILDNLEENICEKRIVEKLQKHSLLDIETAEKYYKTYAGQTDN